MAGDVGAIGHETDPESVAGDGTLIALAKRHRALLISILAVLGAGLPVALVSGRLDTSAVTATATAAAPTYTEGSDVKLSVDLGGTLRTTAGGGGGGNPTGGRLDSIRAIDTVRFLADGRLDSITLIRTIDSLRRIVKLDTLQRIVSFFNTNAVSIGLIDVPPQTQPAITVRAAPEAFNGSYLFTLADAAGVAAANNFLCISSPAAGRTIVILSITISRYSNVAAATNNSIQFFRGGQACTAGTLQVAANIPRFDINDPNPNAEVRTANPAQAVLAAIPVFACAPNHNITAAGTTASDACIWIPERRFLIPANTALLLRQTVAGDTDQRFNITVTWGEK